MIWLCIFISQLITILEGIILVLSESLIVFIIFCHFSEEGGIEMNQIELAEILNVKYLTGLPMWSPDSNWLAYKWNDGGVTDLWLIHMNQSEPNRLPKRITCARSGVSVMAWHPTQNTLAFVMDGNLFILRPDSTEDILQLSFEGGLMSRLTWNPQSNVITVTNGKHIILIDPCGAPRIDMKAIGEVFGGRFSQTVHGDSFDWSPDGTYFLYTWIDSTKKPFLALCTLKDQTIWQSSGHLHQISGGRWVNHHQFMYYLSSPFGAEVQYDLITIPERSNWKDYRDLKINARFTPLVETIYTLCDAQRKLGFTHSASVQPNGKGILFHSEADGFLHHYYYDLSTKTMVQKTFGLCEDYGQAGDQISWSPDGSTFLYASNRNHPIERHIWHHDLNGEERCLVSTPVTNLAPVFSPNGSSFVYTHCDQKKNGDLWLYEFETGRSSQLTDSMPRGLAEKLTKTTLIQYSGADHWPIDAFMFKPKNFDSNKKYPAIVWVHGGPSRQMRGSWHPSSTYAHFYAFNQLLASRGFVVLSPNFRGGIGYGREFRHGLWGVKGQHDTIDIISAASYLKSLPFIDASRVAVYGLSYGGYMTLHSLTQYPDVFACGINIAGLWDIAQWGFWMRNQYGNYYGDPYFLGDMEENPELWAKGSPCTYKINLNKPLLSLQGTADLNVDITQQDKLVRDCVSLGRGESFRAVYYPGESHTFRWRKTWQDAFPIMLDFFARHLQ